LKNPKSIYNSFKKKYPTLGYVLYRFYLQKPINRVKRKIKGKNNKISYSRSILSSVTFDIIGCNNKIYIGQNCNLNKLTFYIRGDNHKIIIKDDVIFFDTSEIVIEDLDCTLTIDTNSRFWGTHIAVTEPNSKISIGKNCSFSYDIDIRTGDSHPIFDEYNNRINHAKDISIADDVWIAAHTRILKGVKISSNSIVATGSIVTKPFHEHNVIIAGNPAKVIKKDVSWSRER